MEKYITFDRQIERIVESMLIRADIQNRQPKLPTFDDLTPDERALLVALVMRKEGQFAYEFVTEAPDLNDVVGALQQLAECQGAQAERTERCVALAELMLQNAGRFIEDRINAALRIDYARLTCEEAEYQHAQIDAQMLKWQTRRISGAKHVNAG